MFCFNYTHLSKVGCWKHLTETKAGGLIQIALCLRAESTVRKYGAAYKRWKEFATAKSYCAMPAQPLQFAEYLKLIADTTESKATVEEAVNATNWLHNLASLVPPAEDGSVKEQ